MAITDLKLKDSDIAAKGVAAAPTVLNGTPEENKRVFDRLVREVLKGDFNGLIDALAAATGAGEIGAAVDGLTGATVQAILNAIKAALDAKASDAATSAALEGKADKLTISSHIKEVELDSSTGVFTFTRQNGTKITIDTALEKVAVNFAYDKATQSLKLTLADGSTETVALSDFITATEFEDSDTLEWSVSADGSKVKATVKAGGITDTMLSSTLKTMLEGYVTAAAASATVAAGSESSALSYKNAAEAAKSDAQQMAISADSAAGAASGYADDAEKSAKAASQSANAAHGSAFDAQDMSYSAMLHAEDAEAWAVGQRNGVNVGADDPAYQKSAKYWAEQAADGGTGGTPGADGKSAYEIAVEEGFEGDETAWLASLKGEQGIHGSDVKMDSAVAVPTTEHPNGGTKLTYKVKQYQADGMGASEDSTTVTIWNGADGLDGTTPHIGSNGNWFLGEEDTGVKAKGTDASVTSANIATALGYTPRKAWYVTITGTPDAPTGDKTPAEIYQAYTEGYAVYAVVQMTDLYRGVPFALPLVAILPVSGSYLACFSTLAEPHFDGAAGIMEITATWNQRWYLFTSAIASKNDIPTIPTALKNPNAITFTGAASGSYDGSAAKTVNIPTVPTALKNPNALTIKIGSTTVTYDGSAAKTVEIPDGTEVSY